ncbi:FAD:protein FMN transferase [Baekduia soli]|uniref:FAD:protein FMN transferase n=1 Tax=Baekduia soli TaxID=496014 RepID=A0A5B8UDZ9_9ACTN|nr:FAD:protein FMN transferase [Baekduia soli]QEC50862.1 FAD:protein FMN transferase [Baekduia soli]
MSAASATATWTALGTTASVTVTDPGALAAARSAVHDELEAIDAACSRFDERSELSRLNARAGRTTHVGPLLLEALETALRAARLTGGLVDPTIGAALVLAGYDEDFVRLPTGPRRPLRAVRVAGWQTVALDAESATVTVPRGVLLDLGATAKALAADRAAAAAARCAPQAGVVVNLGGDLAVAGRPPPGGWAVRVTDDHRAGPGAPGQTVSVRSGGLATSSTTVRRWAGDRHHVLDPATGLPAAGCWRTASVAAATCVDANIASTAAIILGRDAEAWLARHDLPARLVDGEGAACAVGAWPAEPVAA